MLHRIMLATLIAGLSLSITVSASAQSVDDRMAAAKAELDDARARHLNLIAPTNFEKASKSYAAAEKLHGEGKFDKIDDNLSKFSASIDKCKGYEEIGNVLMRETLEARSDALASNAPKFTETEWQKAEKQITAVGKQVEKGAGEKVSKDANKAIDLYKAAELQAIRVDVFGRVKDLRQGAVDAKAEKWAPITMTNAHALLNDAEAVISGDRYKQKDARVLAERAAGQYNHATWIAESVALIDKDRTELEKMVLSHEERLSELAEQLGVRASFSDGFPPLAEDMSASVSSLEADREDLQMMVATLREKTKQLGPLMEIEQAYRQVKGMFSADEADVALTDGSLVVHLHGMSFASGSSEIEPGDFGTLTKVKRTLRAMGNQHTVIEGHTDSTGDREYNQALSYRRAEAVRAYLIANLNRGEGAIEAIGYGSDRPVADNSTDAGRAKNRRIDIVIMLDDGMSASN